MNTPGVEVRLELPRQVLAENSFRAVYKYSYKNSSTPNKHNFKNIAKYKIIVMNRENIFSWFLTIFTKIDKIDWDKTFGIILLILIFIYVAFIMFCIIISW